MNTNTNINVNTDMLIGAPYNHLGRSVDYLRQEIAFFEARLIEMDYSGDCAYEHALSRVYRRLLHERKSQLEALRSETKSVTHN